MAGSGCTCPPDGSSYCAQCQRYAQRAGLNTLASPPPPQDKIPPVEEPYLSLTQGPRADVAQADQYASKLERRYAEMFLALGLANGELTAWWYAPLKFRLAKACFYTPDFLLQYADGHLQIHEVKGRWYDDARVKIKVAARLYPCFSWRAVRWVNGVWRYEDF